jgi:DNA-binding MarR family transcriptional regulator
MTALLSQVFVAFTIECDNEFERQMPHRTAAQGPAGSRREVPWLTSMVMWFTCLRFLNDEDRSVQEVQRLARTSTNWNGMERWGYIDVGPDPADPRPSPPRNDWIVRATPAGRRAQTVWRPLSDEIEGRWRDRFGSERIDELRERLATFVSRLDPDLPDCLPILGYGLFSRLPERRPSPAHDQAVREVGPIALPTLIAKVLLALALEFEGHWPISLATSSDVLGVLDEDGQRLRDLPGRSGVSREAIAMALGVLTKAGLVELGPSPGDSRGKAVRLTEAGRAAQLANTARLTDIEAAWRYGFGSDAFDGLRTSLEGIVEPDAERSPLFRGLVPDPNGWRAAVGRPTTLPLYPMVLHRGGYPDGS